ncbi:MAG: ABC transporter permease [Spirulina sp. SIO3F2]|nr:ABC transporter permease [Spirulina sp. SIO3F2]
MSGQVIWRMVVGAKYPRCYREQLFRTGPGAIAPVLIVALCASAIFTIQTARELTRFGAVSVIGGAFGLAFCRELNPILVACILAGQVGSAFAAELGAMRVSEQIDALVMLQTNPIDFLVIPRVLACCVMLPILTICSLSLGLVGGMIAAGQFYQVAPPVFWEAIAQTLTLEDLGLMLLKSGLFGWVVALIGCTWGLTAQGGAKQVGEAATQAVVNTWLTIFVLDVAIAAGSANLPWTLG